MTGPADNPSSMSGVVSSTVCGRTWHMQRPADLETLWNAMDVLNEDERIPYWTEIWPSSLALGEWLHLHAAGISGKAAVDIGCGLGLTALIGALLGAHVIGMDYEEDALRYASLNARANGTPSPFWTVMDWRQPAIALHSLPFAWAGDIMYEQRFAAPILTFLNHVLAPDGVAWIAEPCRSVYTVLIDAAPAAGLSCSCIWETQVDVPAQTVPVPVRIWEFGRKEALHE